MKIEQAVSERKIENRETGETHAEQVSPEEFKLKIVEESNAEVEAFQEDSNLVIEDAEKSASEEGLFVDGQDAEELMSLNEEAELAKSELTVEIGEEGNKEGENKPQENIKIRKVCPKCGQEGKESHSFCGECGVGLETIRTKVCAGCGKENNLGSKFCEECGKGFEKAKTEPITKSELVTEQAPPLSEEYLRTVVEQLPGLKDAAVSIEMEDGIGVGIEKRSDSRFREGLVDAIEGKNGNEKEVKRVNFFEKTAILADGGSIENQQIDVIKNTDGSSRLNFKLTEDTYMKVAKIFDETECNSAIEYASAGVGGGLSLCDCWEVKKDNISIKISSGKRNGDEWRSTLGLVEISIGADAAMDSKNVMIAVDKILKDNLNIENGLSKPKEQEERQYKESRYRWHHKTEAIPVSFDEIEKNIKRQEVFPGYSTMVEEGKHKEYQEKSEYAVYHAISSSDDLLNIIAGGGLMSTHERMKKGLMVNGKSSMMDLKTGGADSVFTRMVTKEGIKSDSQDRLSDFGINFVFKPDLLDRTDWYAYDSDRYGSTRPDKFAERQSPEEIFEDQKKLGFSETNEQMFRTGIPLEKVAAIVCDNEENVINALRVLMKNNVTEINGIPVEKFIVMANKYSEVIDAANDRTGKMQNQSGEVVAAEWLGKARQIVTMQKEKEDAKALAFEKIEDELSGVYDNALEKIHAADFWENGNIAMEAFELRESILDAYRKVREDENFIAGINSKMVDLDEKWSDDKSLRKMVFDRVLLGLEESRDEDERDLAEKVRRYERI